MPHARTWPALLIPLLLAAGLSGCTVLDDLGDALDGRPQLVEVVQLSEEFVFHATDPPPLPGVAQTASYTFLVPASAQELRLVMTVTFNLPAPPPQGLPQGRVVVTVTPPNGTASVFEFDGPGGDLFAAEPPQPGAHDVRVEALGEGAVRLMATTVQPQT